MEKGTSNPTYDQEHDPTEIYMCVCCKALSPSQRIPFFRERNSLFSNIFKEEDVHAHFSMKGN